MRAGKLYYLRGLEGRKARIKEDLAEHGKIEMDARQEGNSIIMIMVPAKQAD